MPQPAFEELLDEHLMDEQPAPRRGFASGTSTLSGTASAYGFFFVAPVMTAMPAPAHRSVLGPQATIRVQVVEDQTTSDTRSVLTNDAPSSHRAPGADGRHRRTGRVLSSRERGALLELQALGATLTADFTFDELRRAFRALAFEYHPDRHVARSATERARCGQLFVRARDAYRILVEVSKRVH